MENHIYPIRSFIRFQAKQQLLADALAANEAKPSRSQGFLSSRSAATPQHTHGTEADAAQNRGHGNREARETFCFDTASIDNDLLREITSTLFNSDQYPELYRPCRDIIEATAIEEAIALEIVMTYRRIKRNEQLSQVQTLNRLL